MRLSVAFLVFVLIAAVPCFGQVAQTTSASPLGNADAGKVETAVGDLCADAVRDALRVQVGFVQANELKSNSTPIAAGTVSSTQIAELVSYPNDPLAVLSLQGKVIREALEKSVSIYPQRQMGFLQVSGIRFTFDPSRPVGSRVTYVSVGVAELRDNDFYTVGMTSSMANGALGYWKVWTKNDIRKRVPDMNIVRAVESYFRAHPQINYGTLDRIKAGQ